MKTIFAVCVQTLKYRDRFLTQDCYPAQVAASVKQSRDTSIRHTSQRRVTARGVAGTKLPASGRATTKGRLQIPYNYPVININVLGGPNIDQTRNNDSLASTVSYTEFSVSPIIINAFLLN